MEEKDIQVTDKEPSADVVKRVNSMAKFLRDYMESMEVRMQELEKAHSLRAMGIASEEQNELRKALAQAALDSEIPEKTGSSQGGRASYNLDDLQRACKEALKKNNIEITFEERKNENNEHVLITIVTHTLTGQFKTFTTDRSRQDSKITIQEVLKEYDRTKSQVQAAANLELSYAYVNDLVKRYNK